MTRPSQWVDLPEAPRARTLATLGLMSRLVREACKDPEFVWEARQIALNGARAHDTAGQAAAILRHVQTHCRYILDPPDVEVLATPQETLRTRAGDCDELAGAVLGLARAVGIEGRFVAVTWDLLDPEWRHVYTELEVRPGVWAAADPTVTSLRLGQVHRPGVRPLRVQP